MHGHDGKLLFGLLKSTQNPILLMMGRAQSVQMACFLFQIVELLIISVPSYYEGHSMQDITFPIRLLCQLGVETLIGARALIFIDVIC